MKKINEKWVRVGESPSGSRTYYVSNLGRLQVYNNNTDTTKISNGYINRSTGYASVRIGKKTRYIHQLVAEAFLPPPPQDGGWYEVGHRDGNKLANCADNLKYVSRRENGADEIKRERQRKNHKTTGHAGDVLMGTKNGETKYWKNGIIAAKDLECSHVLVYNAIGHKQSARKAKGWDLRWVAKTSVPLKATVIGRAS